MTANKQELSVEELLVSVREKFPEVRAYIDTHAAPEPSDEEIERVSDEQLDALAEMHATVAVKGKLLMQLINEIRYHRRIEAAYKRGKGE